MTPPVISANRLGKRYEIGALRQRHDTLRDSIMANLSGAARWLRRARTDADVAMWALRDVTFDVEQGEVVGIIGRNGAGKSTLLKILSRVTRPTEGFVDLRGRVGSLLEVGTGFHPELTGRENIFLNGAILGMRRSHISKKFDEIVAFAEIDKFLDTPVKRYSSGMYVRLAFAVAAHMEPDVLLVDEVLAVGDGLFQKKCLGKMREVAKQGRTIFLVSHNIAAVRSLCTSAVWLQHGSIESVGSADDVTRRYLSFMTGSSATVCNLDDLPRAGHQGRTLRLLAIAFNEGRSIQHGEPLTVRLEFKTSGPVHNVALGVGFNSLDGTRILSVDSDLYDERCDIADGIRDTVVVRLDTMHLQPGQYTVDVGARSGLGGGLDTLMNCMQIEVSLGPRTPPQLVRNDGGVRLPAAWEWPELSHR